MYYIGFSGDIFLTVLVFKKLYTFILDFTLDLTNYPNCLVFKKLHTFILDYTLDLTNCSNCLVLRNFTYYTSKDSDHTVIYDLVIYTVMQRRILYRYIIQDYT